MSNLANRKGSLAGKLKGRHAWWFIGAVAAAIVAILSVGTASAHIDNPGTYTGDVEASGDCGGGTISVTTDDEGADVTGVTVTDVNVDGEAVSGSATFDAGTVAISDDDGSFTAYFDVEGHEVAVSGTFGDTGLEGSVTVTPSTCGALAYSAVLGTTAAPTALPGTGTGSTSSDSTGASWALIAAALALVSLGAGVVVLRRRA